MRMVSDAIILPLISPLKTLFLVPFSSARECPVSRNVVVAALLEGLAEIYGSNSQIQAMISADSHFVE